MTPVAFTAALVLHFPVVSDASPGTAPQFLIERSSIDHRPSLPVAQTSSSIDQIMPALETRAIAHRDLQRLGGYPEGWDGQGAASPDAHSIDLALMFLRLESPLKAWEVGLHADGRAILDLDEGGRFTELTFGPAGQVVIVSRVGDGPARAIAVEFDGVALPPSLVQA